ncbi:MAG: poly(ribitol-phosphate) beta-N-acetylglucosaminyltransferase, partial [Solirubrobacteraceae bacterium]|nr:poly(ribitol-phosphate) beta-N-acetylglucosaminyltransferase [Solirubrobacteraceae bacterium]
MAVKVSVVVPVYNPGPHIDDCIASVLRQSLPASEYEAIFVDDGSTDGTGERLDEIAAEHPHLRVIHIENSGWPGRPRNVGVDAARGEYVYFVDNDDWIGDEALERLHGTALRTGADVVVGKVVGQRRQVPRELFRRNRDDATLERDPLLTLLSPHKLFRRAFLDEHGLRFPEGRRRLEDHVFVLPAYFLARRIAVLSDYPCYHWVRRDDRTNASTQRADRGYFDNLREVLDIVEAHTEPGPFRDRLLSHWYRSKMLNRLGGGRFRAYPEDYRAELFQEIRTLAAERFGPGVVARLSAILRIRAALMTAGRFDGLAAFAEFETAMRAQLEVRGAEWDGGTLRVHVAGTIADAGGRPLTFRREEGRMRLVLPEDLPGADDVTLADRDVEDEVARSALRAFVRDRSSGEELLLPLDAEVELREAAGEATVHLQGVVRLDPDTAAAGGPLRAGVWDAYALIASCGVSVTCRMAAPGGAMPPPALAGAPARVAIPYRTVAGNLSVDVGEATTSLFAAARPPVPARAGAAFDGDGIDLALDVPVAMPSGGVAGHAQLVLSAAGDGGARVAAPARLVPAGAGARLESRVAFARAPAGDRVTPGTWDLSAALGARPAELGLSLEVAEDGSAVVRR